MRKIKLFTLVASLMLAMGAWADSSGTCGDGLSYVLSNGTLTITYDGVGSGEMTDFYDGQGENFPWWEGEDEDCSGISTIILPTGLTNIPTYAFVTASITEITIPNSVTSIGEGAFQSSADLASITFGNGLATIGASAFSDCASITSIVLPASLTEIAEYAFTSCSLLRTITLNGNVSIDENAFYDCMNVKCYVPYASLATYQALSIANVTFEEKPTESGTCSKPGSYLTWAYYGDSDKRLVISGSGEMPDYTQTGANAAPWSSKKTSITSVVLPEGLTHIGAFAFFGLTNSNFTSVTIPSTVTSIGNKAFYAATSSASHLANVICLSSTAPTLDGNSTFRDDDADFAAIHFPAGCGQSYANKWVQYWDILKETGTENAAPIPHATGNCGASGSNVTYEFTHVGGVRMLILSGSGAMADYEDTNATDVPWYSFKKQIEAVVLPAGLTKIGARAFQWLYITEITLPDGLEEIHDRAFYRCQKLTEITIPSSITKIEGDAFYGCCRMEKVYMSADPENLTWTDTNVDDFCKDGMSTQQEAESYTVHKWNGRVFKLTKCFVPAEHFAGYISKWGTGSIDHNTGTDVNVYFTVEGLSDAENNAKIEEVLSTLHNQVLPDITLTRPVNCDGYYNTLCVPFDMTAEDIAESSLNGAEIREFVDAQVDEFGLQVWFQTVTSIEAGKPYFIKYEVADALDCLDFLSVTIKSAAPTPVVHNNVTFVGTYTSKAVSAQTGYSNQDDVLFLGANNTLFWPSQAGNIKPFRAYLKVNTSGGGSMAPRRGMPVFINEAHKAPTALDNISDKASCAKYMEGGQLIIEKNGVRYNAQGLIVK